MGSERTLTTPSCAKPDRSAYPPQVASRATPATVSVCCGTFLLPKKGHDEDGSEPTHDRADHGLRLAHEEKNNIELQH